MSLRDQVQFFGVVPRVADTAACGATAVRTLGWADRAGLDGVLFFTGPGATLDPWLAAATTCAKSSRLQPFVALNPAYQHPFASARAVSTIAQLYGRPLALNLITGTSVDELTQLGGALEHDDRYERLVEHAEIMLELLRSPRPVTREGRFYQVTRLQLLPRLDPSLLPQVFLAGHSPAARGAASRLQARSLGMLRPDLAEDVHSALHLGVVVRATTDEAWAAAERYYPDDPEERAVFEAGMRGTDSAWKRSLVAVGGERNVVPGYWLRPFLSGQADCPYVVGSRDQLTSLIGELTSRGVRTMLFDVPATQRDYDEVALLLASVREYAP